MKSHQRHVRRLVEWIQGKPPLSIADGLVEIPLETQGLHEPVQDSRELAPYRLGLEKLPVVELDALFG
jgi:hypothetical protein